MELDLFKLTRTQAALRALGVDVALFTEFYNVSYLTGFTKFLENGPHPLTHGLAAALLAPNQLTLIVDAQAEPVTVANWTGVTAFYQGYSFHAPNVPPRAFVESVLKVAGRDLPQRGKVGVEMEFIPAAIMEQLRMLRPQIAWVPLPVELMLAVRAVKSDAEIERLRACARLADVGQKTVCELVQQPGLSEIAVYSQAKAAMEAFVGERFALQNALHGGKNAAHVFPGMPTGYVLQKGDMLINDMVPYYRGYWGDNCSTFVVGGESAITQQHRRIHQIARDAFMVGLEAVRPGVTGGQLDEMVRGYIRQQGYEYPHHTGHGVGVSNHEEPRIIVGAQTVLEPGMVCVFEPGVYVEGFGGVRQERMFLVTNDGAELMTQNSFELS